MVGSRPYPADQVELSFIRTLHGGVQYVLAKSTNNVELINLIQAHLSTSAEQFKRGDFSVAELMHGFIMPGLAQLKLAKPDDIKFEYRALENGGKIHYSSDYPQFVSALHEWLEARAREHSNTDIPDHKLQHLTNSD
ncbi:hypothetical protein A1342_07645 [Methylomonas methanica]|uniref:Uncharacterized protein n=2 Tax=Methylomonas TaxID=416 RepID=A0A140E6R1_9GAMM|nr:hypothetical protein JT25_021810 [Methylomonas denitrificans]OAH99672.1 hypothetical protein A1342_07645 [Methylomonas methanica]